MSEFYVIWNNNLYYVPILVLTNLSVSYFCLWHWHNLLILYFLRRLNFKEHNILEAGSTSVFRQRSTWHGEPACLHTWGPLPNKCAL